MEIAIIRRETTGSGPNVFNENETIAKYEIMDGSPVRGESIPIRVFLAGYDLTPTMRDINKKFSVRYYLNLVLVDEEERRYFKQQVKEYTVAHHFPASVFLNVLFVFIGDHALA
jgi:vacuolar protein sorting-associated protein 26